MTRSSPGMDSGTRRSPRSLSAGNPNAYVQQTAGHSQYRITERYIHAEQTAFPGAAEKTEARVFGSVDAG